MLAEQLLTDADAQHRLAKTADHLVQTVRAEIGHGMARLSLTGKYHFLALAQHEGVVGHNGFGSQTVERTLHREYVACIVFHYADTHFTVSL